MTPCFGHAHRCASHDVLRFDGMSIHLLAGFIVGTKRGALEENPGKHAAGTRVADDLGSFPSVGIRGSITSFGFCGDSSIRAHLILAAHLPFHAAVLSKSQD